MAEVLVDLASVALPVLLNSVLSKMGDVDSLSTTEVSAQKNMNGSSDSSATMNVAPKSKMMEQQAPSLAINVSDMQATSDASVTQIMSDPVQVADFVILPTMTVNTVLYSTPIGPRSIKASSETRVSYLSRMYQFWRGDFDFMFIFTKTILIQTKLMAVFVPGALPTDPAPTAAQSTYYKHRVLMNPANEETYHLRVPFVSTTPFNEMRTETGMLYVIVYQPLVISVGDTNSIPVSILLSAVQLSLHEYVTLPDLDNQVIPFIPPEYSYNLIATSQANITNAVNDTATFSYITDSGAVHTGNCCKTNYAATTQRKPVIGTLKIFSSNHVYTPTTERTLVGEPAPGATAIWERIILVPTATTLIQEPWTIYTDANGNIWARGGTGPPSDCAIFAQNMIAIFEWPIIYSVFLNQEEVDKSNRATASRLEKKIKQDFCLVQLMSMKLMSEGKYTEAMALMTSFSEEEAIVDQGMDAAYYHEAHDKYVDQEERLRKLSRQSSCLSNIGDDTREKRICRDNMKERRAREMELEKNKRLQDRKSVV